MRRYGLIDLQQIGERVGLHFSAVGMLCPLCFSSRDRFICKAVEEQGYRASEMADYLGKILYKNAKRLFNL